MSICLHDPHPSEVCLFGHMSFQTIFSIVRLPFVTSELCNFEPQPHVLNAKAKIKKILITGIFTIININNNNNNIHLGTHKIKDNQINT